jgi:Spy/CpxP family protein refolding chaperone
MKRNAIVGFCVILALALVATVALAWGPGFGPWFGRGFGGSANGVPPIPDLTAEQSSQIQALRDGFLKEIEPLREELFTKGTELRTLWSSHGHERSIRSLVNQRGAESRFRPIPLIKKRGEQ